MDEQLFCLVPQAILVVKLFKKIHRRPASRINFYEEPKKQRNIQVTSVGWKGIRAIAIERGLSLNELIEQIGKGLISPWR